MGHRCVYAPLPVEINHMISREVWSNMGLDGLPRLFSGDLSVESVSREFCSEI